jgi:hypothetical protein
LHGSCVQKKSMNMVGQRPSVSKKLTNCRNYIDNEGGRISLKFKSRGRKVGYNLIELLKVDGFSSTFFYHLTGVFNL